MSTEIDVFWGHHGDYTYCYLFNYEKLDIIDLEKDYFNPIIIHFCGKKQLTDKVIQSISKVIEDKDGVDHENETNKINFMDESKMINTKNKLNGKNKVGFWQHFLLILLFILLCLSLFLCFKVSIYFLIPSVICFAFDLYLGFRNYFYGYYCTQKIEIPWTLNYKSNLEQIYPNQKEPCSIDNKLGSVHIKQK